MKNMKRIIALLVTCLSVQSLIIAQNTIPYGNNPSAGKYAVVNGIKLYYEIYGEGLPLLLLHGNGGSIAGRAAEIAAFSKKYKVIAVDSRCHGKSGCMPGDLNYEMMAADINALLTQLNIDSCLIWGHSDGGIIGLIMAIQYQDKVKKLVTTGANVTPDTSAIFPQLLALEKMYPMIPDTMQQKHLKLMVYNPNISFAELKKIKCPVLVMAGDRDAIREEHTIKIYQSIPNAQLCIVQGATHFFSGEKPALFMLLVTDFFEKPFTMPSTVAIAQKMAEQMMQQQGTIKK
jgi:pimeloyl-ACP methyl ester carboxylesterase